MEGDAGVKRKRLCESGRKRCWPVAAVKRKFTVSVTSDIHRIDRIHRAFEPTLQGILSDSTTGAPHLLGSLSDSSLPNGR